jgi:hypothetical protein
VKILSWLAFAPLVVGALLVCALRTGQRENDATLREDILAAALVLAVAIALGTEALSEFHAISYGGVVAFWLATLAAGAATLAWRWRRAGPPASLRIPTLDAVDRCLVAGIVSIALALLVVAWLAPPQSSDSIGYHMSRVMHWIQNRSIAHYPTFDSRQLFDPPFAEMVRLHLYLLAGGDRAGCLLQWFAAMGALAGASLVARDLGGGRRTQIFAAVFALTLPIGITQASSGKNGWVEALWLLSLVHFSGASGGRARTAPTRSTVFAAFAALGLELMTKPSAWVFAPPFVVLAILGAARARRAAGRQLATLPVPVVAGMVLVCALVVPYVARNLSTFGDPLADPFIQPSARVERITPAAVVSNVVRNAAFQFGTPSPAINKALMRLVVGVHHLIGADPFDPLTSALAEFRISPPTRIEELAFSPLHILLVMGAGLAILASRRLRTDGLRLPHLAAVGAGYVAFCAFVRWQGPNCRLLMPLLVLSAPLVAVVVADMLDRRALPAIASVLFVACLPYAVATHARPLSFEPHKGLLAAPRTDLYFARVPELRHTYEEVARAVRDTHTRNLGVVFPDDAQPEYLLWVLLKDAQPPVRIETLAVPNDSARLASLSPFCEFRPEMVVVFASKPKEAKFSPELVAQGMRLAFVRSSGLAGFYALATERGEP